MKSYITQYIPIVCVAYFIILSLCSSKVSGNSLYKEQESENNKMNNLERLNFESKQTIDENDNQSENDNKKRAFSHSFMDALYGKRATRGGHNSFMDALYGKRGYQGNGFMDALYGKKRSADSQDLFEALFGKRSNRGYYYGKKASPMSFMDALYG
jgi:hypothetical protein